MELLILVCLKDADGTLPVSAAAAVAVAVAAVASC